MANIFTEFVDFLLGRRNLAKAAAESGEHLDYNKSLVDLLKTLDMPSNFQERKVLAKHFGMREEYHGTASQNIWLHDQIKKRYAART